jgi:hypothetical protein
MMLYDLEIIRMTAAIERDRREEQLRRAHLTAQRAGSATPAARPIARRPLIPAWTRLRTRRTPYA